MTRPFRAIVVDDSPIAAKLLGLELQLLGFDAKTSASLDRFASLVTEFEPDVVLTDLNMPDVVEDEVCVRLRSALGERRALIWIVSGLEEAELSRKAAALGADGYLSKTVVPEEMRRRLQKLLEDVSSR